MSKNSYLDCLFTLIISVLGNLNFHKSVSQCWQFLEQLGSSVPISWDDQVLSKAGVPNPPTMEGTRSWPVGTRLPSRRWAVSKWAKLHLYLQPLPITGFTAWARLSDRSAALDAPRNANPTVNCAYQGPRLHAPYEKHPETIGPPPWSMEKSSSTQLVPGTKTVGDCWCKLKLRTAEKLKAKIPLSKIANAVLL